MSIRTKKSLGQHFLSNPSYGKRILRYAQIDPLDTVVEIGPGTGALTALLLSTARKVIAIELDAALIKFLKDRFHENPALQLVEADVLRLDWDLIVERAPVKIVGNLPYNISTRILLKMTELKDRFHSFTFMVQKEVAQRILAQPESKDYGYFTLLMDYHFTRLKGFDVPAGAFVPPPKVVSSVMKLLPQDPPYPVTDYDHFVALLKAAFRHRRKTLWNNLKPNMPEPGAIGPAFSACRVGPRARPEQVTLEQYSCLARMLSSSRFLEWVFPSTSSR